MQALQELVDRYHLPIAVSARSVVFVPRTTRGSKPAAPPSAPRGHRFPPTAVPTAAVPTVRVPSACVPSAAATPRDAPPRRAPDMDLPWVAIASVAVVTVVVDEEKFDDTEDAELFQELWRHLNVPQSACVDLPLKARSKLATHAPETIHLSDDQWFSMLGIDRECMTSNTWNTTREQLLRECLHIAYRYHNVAPPEELETAHCAHFGHLSLLDGLLEAYQANRQNHDRVTLATV